MIGATDGESYAGCCEAIAAMDLRPVLPDDRARRPSSSAAGSIRRRRRSISETIAAGIPGSRLEVLEAAHFANWELADEVNRLLAAHLDGANDG